MSSFEQSEFDAAEVETEEEAPPPEVFQNLIMLASMLAWHRSAGAQTTRS